MKYRLIITALIIILLMFNPVNAAELKNYYLQTSFYTYHYIEKK